MFNDIRVGKIECQGAAKNHAVISCQPLIGNSANASLKCDQFSGGCGVDKLYIQFY